MNNYGHVEIPRGWYELRAWAKIRADDRIRRYNGPIFVRCDSLNLKIVGGQYMKNCVGRHWTIIRKRK